MLLPLVRAHPWVVCGVGWEADRVWIALTVEDIESIDEAGKKGARKLTVRTFVHRLAFVALAAAVGFGVASFLGIDVL